MPSLVSLSDPALARLWEHLLGDLPTHVALTQTCRRLRAVYCQEDDRWRAACFVAGFGRPLRAIEAVSLSDELSWRGLACIIVKHADKCEISSCIKANACFGESVVSLPRLPYFPWRFCTGIQSVGREVADMFPLCG